MENPQKTHGPIGNKFEKLIVGPEFIGIEGIIAESFITSAKNGMLQLLDLANLNFNKDGVYEVEYSVLESLLELMLDIKATYLKFSLVEIDRRKYNLNLNPHFNEDNLIYLAVSLEDKNEVTIDEHNYLLFSTSDQLNNLRISNSTLDLYKEAYLQKYLPTLNKYFSNNNLGSNTMTISYHIHDLENMISRISKKYLVYLCEISDVMAIIRANSLKVSQLVYRTYYQFRIKQLTIVFYSVDDGKYYDMGSLYP
ncbi:hypothetical protein [Chryseobacterium sp.]|uniref:hypothetical protein n=1 Tax=Chryseobacterium sp. TaxID=1871047 RepID=UPI0025BD7E11|nr:hypothetical protein [Chryseobacterium sp.]MBV8324832.1 hypothetical protein [Chryseobacterium sp.]